MLKSMQYIKHFIQIGNFYHAPIVKQSLNNTLSGKTVKISSPKKPFLVQNQCFCVDITDVIGVLHGDESGSFQFTIIL